MKRNTIYLVDEDHASRRANRNYLEDLLDCDVIEIVALEPFRDKTDYDRLIISPNTAAFVLDQRMKGSGAVNYNGTDLAQYIRRIDSKIPIYILTGYADEDDEFLGSNYLVEYIIAKESIEDLSSETAITIKARILRGLSVFDDVRSELDQRYHDLLLKSFREPLSEKEENEMNSIEGESSAAILAIERKAESELGKAIDALKKFLPKDHS